MQKFKNYGVKIASLLLFSLLVIQVLSILPITPVKLAYAEPLTQSGSAITRSKTYTWKELGTTKTTTIELRAEPNGTVVFSRDSQEVFRTRVPSALAGSTTLFSNSTYVAVNLTLSNFFIKQKWKTDGANFKLEICWNLPFAVSLRLPLNKIKQFVDYKLDLGGIVFDWNDAVKQGFIPDFENATSSIRVSIPATGCLDPTLQTTNVVFGTGLIGANNLWESQGLRWAFWQNSTGLYYNYSSNGVSWSAGSKLRNGASDHVFDVYDDGNSFHIAQYTGFVIFYLRYTHTSAGSVTLQTSLTLYSCGGNGCGRPKINVNSTGFPMITFTDRGSLGNTNIVKLLRSRTIDGLSWFNATVPTVAATGTDVSLPDICSIGSGNLLITYFNASSIKAKQFYQTNSSIGNQEILSTGTVSIAASGCTTTSNNVAHVFYYTTRYQYVNRTSSTVKSTPIPIGPSSGVVGLTDTFTDSGLSVGVNKNTNNSLSIIILSSSDLTIYYLLTSSNLAFIVNSSRSGGVGTQDFVSVAGYYTNNITLGYLTTQGTVSPFDVVYTQFDSVKFQITVRFYMNDGNSALSLTSITFQAPNGTITNVGSGNSATFLGHVGCWTPDAFRWQGGNVKANSTTFCLSGTGAQTFSFRLRIYQVDINGVRKDGVTTTYDNFMLRGTWPNGTSINSVNSTSQAISDFYIQNGTNTLTAWWVVGSRAIIVNNSFSHSFTSASTLNYILQLLEEASSGANFRFALNMSTVEFTEFNAGNRTLRFNSTSSSNPQILLRFLTDTYKAAPDEVWHNSTLHNDPCCFEDNTRWFHNTNHPNRFLYNSLVFRAPTPGAGPGAGGDAPAAAGGGALGDVVAQPVIIEVEAAQTMQQLPAFAGAGTIAIVVLVLSVSLIGRARESRSISSMLRSSTKRPKFIITSTKRPKFVMKKERVKR